MKRLFKRFFLRPELSAIIILLVLVVLFESLSGRFLTMRNARVILGVLPELGLVALGATMLMIAGEFDLSVGSVFAIVPMITALLASFGWNIWLAILCALLAACVLGFINGWITLQFAIPSFVTTLGMLFAVRSLTVVISGGFPPPFPEAAPEWAFTAQIGIVRVSLIWFIGFVILATLLLRNSNFGNWMYATGGDPNAAANMGINTHRVKIACFMMCSFLAGFAGLIQLFRLKSALPSLGVGLELEAIAASVIGGAALTGGIGSALGAVVGAALIRIIDNGLVISRVDANWFQFAIGFLTIAAVIFNAQLRKLARGMKVSV